MGKKNIFLIIILILILVFVILFWDKFIIKNEEIINADYCEIDSDCVLAVNLNNCCIRPIPINKKIVELDENYTIYQEGVDYLRDYSQTEKCFSEDRHSLIAGCDAPMIAIDYNKPLVCVNNKCKVFIKT